MKERWLKLAARIDAMQARERALVFAVAMAALGMLLYTLAVEPLLLRRSRLNAQIAQDKAQTTAIAAELKIKLAGGVIDPDAPARMRIASAQEQITALQQQLRDMQGGLVPPDKIAALMENVLRRNGTVRLLAMRTLPVVDVMAAAQNATARPAAPAAPAASGPKPSLAAASTGADTMKVLAAAAAEAAAKQAAEKRAAAAAAQPAPQLAARPGAIFRHGVELTLEGSYADMVAYLSALEHMQYQLFWGNARLNAGAYPRATLTLTLYTMSLDPKWLHL